MDLVRSGVFAKLGLWLNDLDVTLDLLGTVLKQSLKEHMLTSTFPTKLGVVAGDTFRMAKSKGKAVWANNTILRNDHKVGMNCLTYMTRVSLPSNQKPSRSISYEKGAHPIGPDTKESVAARHRVEEQIKTINARLKIYDKLVRAHTPDSERTTTPTLRKTLYVTDLVRKALTHQLWRRGESRGCVSQARAGRGVTPPLLVTHSD